jgi:DNA-binding MurR/RpiR family transcriptional regulator
VDAPPELAARISTRDRQLTGNDRLIADYLLDHAEDAAFASAEEVARAVGVSKAALVRFGMRLGLGGYGGLQELLEAEVRRRLHDQEPGSAAPVGLVRRLHDAVVADLGRSMAETGPEAVEQAAATLDTGKGSLHVFGQRASAAVAEYAFFLLNPLLPQVVRIEAGESAIADHLLDVGPDDRLLAVTFRRYAKLTTEVVRYFHEAGGAVVLVTDSRAAPAAGHADVVLVCADDAPTPFPTAVPGVFLLEALVAALVERDPERARRRRGEAERVWGRFGTY